MPFFPLTIDGGRLMTQPGKVPAYRFPDGFVWDHFATIPGKIKDGTSPATACDHYHRFEADAALMRDLGLKHYRLSVAWPRVVPDGSGPINEKGLDFYDRLIDTLISHGVTPWVTLFHWDLPQALEDKGGWPVRGTVDAFRPYAEAVVKRLGDRVSHWFSVNEIPCFIGYGYNTGYFAPGRKEPASVVNQAYHHALLVHGHAVSAVREFGKSGSIIGLVHNHLPPPPIPVIETEANIAAARAEYERTNRHLMAPIFQGKYSEAFLVEAGADAPKVEAGDLEIIGQPLDFLGLNLYAGDFVRAKADGTAEILPFPRQYPTGNLPWIKVSPEVLYWGIRFASEVFGVKTFYMTENGAAFDDMVTPEGEILDLDRREYIRNHLISIQRALGEGYDVRGYFLWTLLDNWEWAEGFNARFGIVRTDFETLARKPKLSARWYSEVAQQNRIV